MTNPSPSPPTVAPLLLQPLPPAPLLSYAGPPALPTTWTNIRTYRLQPALRLRVVLRLCIISTVLNALIFATFLCLATSLFGNKLTARPSFIIVATAIFTTYTTVRTCIRVLRQWKTFELTVADQGVMRAVRGLPPLVMSWSEIHVMDDFNFEFALRGTPREKAIAVTEALEDFTQVRAFIADHLAPGTRRAGKSRRRLAWYLARVLGVALLPWACVYFGYFFQQLWIAVAAFVLCAAATAWLMTKTMRNANLTPARKVTALALCWIAPTYLLARIAYLLWMAHHAI